MNNKLKMLLLCIGLTLLMSACGGGGGGGDTKQPPSISTQPPSIIMVAGNSTAFSVGASGTGLGYQWQVDSGSGVFTNVSDTGVYSGATTANLALTSVTISMNGYKYRVVVNDSATLSTTSNSATLTVAVPSKVIVKLATIGTLPPGLNIGGISTTINYSTNKGLTITDSDVIASGEAAGATMLPNVTNSGEVILGNFTLSGTGFSKGEFATLTFTIASGNSPMESDFTVVSPTIISSSEDNPTDLSELSVVIQSVTFQ